MTLTSHTPAPLGILHQMWAAAGVSDREAVAMALDEIRFADDLGFDSVWIGEHHLARPEAAYYGRVPAVEIFLSHLAAKTRRIAIGTGVKVLSTSSALRAAEEMSMLDLLTDGRAEFGLGLGTVAPTSIADPDEKARQFRAALGEILALLRGDRSTGLPELSPRPSASLAERIWVAGRDPETVAFTAARGLNFVVGQAEIGIRQADHVRHYRQSGGTGSVRGVRLVFVAETHEEAAEESRAAATAYFGMMSKSKYYKEAVGLGLIPESAATLAEMRRYTSFIAGTPEEVAADLNEYASLTDIDRLDVMVQIPGFTSAQVRRSMRLMKEEVQPRLRLRPSPMATGKLP